MTTIQETIAEIGRKHPKESLTALNHYLTAELLREAYRKLRKDAAPGIDGNTTRQYGVGLEDRLPGLIDEIKSGRYRAHPARRGYIPKPGKAEKRPLGIPVVEDKLVEKAVTMILEPLYEQEFFAFSYGFRRGVGALEATRALRAAIEKAQAYWMVEVDIRKFFDTLSHRWLREFLRQRVRDGVIVRLIDKWLKAGVMEAGTWQATEEGTPQGGVISPLLANLYLHEVLAKWYVQEIKPRLRGRSFLIRYADDFVMGFEREEDARRVMEVLPKRFGRFDLSLNTQKTRQVDFRKPRDPDDNPDTFDFLGFTHYWGKTRAGRPTHKLKTAKDRLARSCRAVWEWCRRYRHWPVPKQRQWLNWKLRGHYGYYGITYNLRAMRQFYLRVRETWLYWLSRRGSRPITWPDFESLLKRNPLSPPRIVHDFYRPCERSV
jgi:group II intron reverse transcriptase/maturase